VLTDAERAGDVAAAQELAAVGELAAPLRRTALRHDIANLDGVRSRAEAQALIDEVAEHGGAELEAEFTAATQAAARHVASRAQYHAQTYWRDSESGEHSVDASRAQYHAAEHLLPQVQ
jgi:hypothetical protein